MNTDTGKAYSRFEDVAAAIARGEHLTPISDRAAKRIVAARRALAAQIKSQRSRRDKSRRLSRMQKASRRANRR